MRKKCPRCKEVKSLKDFHKSAPTKDGHHSWCKNCVNTNITKLKNTERGYLKTRYDSMSARERVKTYRKWGRPSKCYITFEELWAAWEKHKSIYGRRSAWGPGINNLEQHLPITLIQKGEGQLGKSGCLKGSKRILSNLSVDRLDSRRDYTLQNIIFIRADENARKNSSSYEDCKIQMKLHEERFKNEI